MNIKTIKKHIVWGILFTIHCSLFTSCIDEDEHENTPQGNFEALWKIVDEHYCFFDYKQHEYGLDWNAVYNKYNVRARENLNREQLFEVLTDMLGELKDGHVNLSTAQRHPATYLSRYRLPYRLRPPIYDI